MSEERIFPTNEEVAAFRIKCFNNLLESLGQEFAAAQREKVNAYAAVATMNRETELMRKRLEELEGASI